MPAYTFPGNLEDIAVLRVVVRNGFSHDMADLLLADLRRHIGFIEQLKSPLPQANTGGFHH